MLPHLSFEIEMEIIKRLPVKSLIQFRSVCKAWKALIDSSNFITSYKVRHDQPQHLMISYDVGYEVGDRLKPEVKCVCFVDDDTFPKQKFALTIPPVVQAENIICSSHGLLCFYDCFPERNKSCPTSDTDMLILWNPAIRKWIGVALPNVVHMPFTYVVSFGGCPDTIDPKLVMITYIRDYSKMESISCIPCQVMVFKLSSGEWVTSCSNQPRKSIAFTCSQTVVGQFIYRLAYDRTADGFHNLIISFDISTEEFGEIDLPDYLADHLRESDLSVSRLRESLVVVETGDVFEDLTCKGFCDVWMMEHGDSKAFTKLFTIKLPDASLFSTLGFRKSGEPIVEMGDDNEDLSALFVYEPCSEHIKELGIRGNRFLYFESSYTESLLLLDHADGHIIKCGAVKR